MTCVEHLASCKGRLEKLDDRIRAAFGRMDDDAMNAPSPPSQWSPAQILDHVMKANAPYLTALRTAIEAAPLGDSEVKFSRVALLIIKYGGPGGNAPAPKQTVPEAKPHTKSILDDYFSQTAELKATMDLASGKDTNLARLTNPFVPIFRMTVADVFEIAAQHTERHVGQIEASLKG